MKESYIASVRGGPDELRWCMNGNGVGWVERASKMKTGAVLKGDGNVGDGKRVARGKVVREVCDELELVCNLKRLFLSDHHGSENARIA